MRRAWIGVMAAAAALSAAPRPADQRPSFRSGVDLVSVNVTVSDRKGALVTTLNQDDFEILEDGRKQAITFFVAGGQRGRGEAGSPFELHLGVLLDISGSMELDIRQAQNAAVKFLTTLDGADDFTLVDFDTQVRVARFGQADFPRLVERIRNRRPGGNTALYDAMGVYLDTASSEQGRKILILYSDGADNQSEITLADLRDLLKASDVTVYTIGYFAHMTSSARAMFEMNLKDIAEITGGQFFDSTSPKEIESSYAKIRAEIDAQYTIGYLSSNSSADGAWRKVEIRLVGPNRRDLRLRARKGYFAPYREGGDAGPAPSAHAPRGLRR